MQVKRALVASVNTTVESQLEKLSLNRLVSARRKAISTATENWVRVDQLHARTSLPLVIRPDMEEMDLISWAADNREFICDRPGRSRLK